jgi:hypothetical protein
VAQTCRGSACLRPCPEGAYIPPKYGGTFAPPWFFDRAPRSCREWGEWRIHPDEKSRDVCATRWTLCSRWTFRPGLSPTTQGTPCPSSFQQRMPSHPPTCLLPAAHCIKTLSLSCTFWQTMRLKINSGMVFVKGGLAYHEEVFFQSA